MVWKVVEEMKQWCAAAGASAGSCPGDVIEDEYYVYVPVVDLPLRRVLLL
jgi:hypothetical protein